MPQEECQRDLGNHGLEFMEGEMGFGKRLMGIPFKMSKCPALGGRSLVNKEEV